MFNIPMTLIRLSKEIRERVVVGDSSVGWRKLWTTVCCITLVRTDAMEMRQKSTCCFGVDISGIGRMLACSFC